MAELNTKDRKGIPDTQYAFPKERKEPLENASHVRNAIARFNQVSGVSEAEKEEAWRRIKAAAKKFGVEMGESERDELKSHKNPGARAAASRKKAAKKAAKKAPAKKAARKAVASKK